MKKNTQFSEKQSAAALSSARAIYLKNMSNPLKFSMFAFSRIPMLFLSGTKILHLSETCCETALPYRWLNQNPFKSIYFATQSMAAELSTGALALMATQGYKPSVAAIVVSLKADFLKKADGKTIFSCTDGQKALDAVKKCVETRQATTADLYVAGKRKDGTPVSEFTLRWSFKQRSGKK